MSRRPLHGWDVTPKEAVRIQERLRQRLRHDPPPSRPRLVAGADCAFPRGTDRIVAVAVLFRLPLLELVEKVVLTRPLDFPYVPGLLTFREAPAVIEAVDRLSARPEVLLVDGQGIAHPRRMGLAAHLGLWLDLPTVGCAKSRLCGETRGEPGPRRGSYRTITDRGEAVGRLVRTRDAVKPMWISPGHRCDVPGAMRLALLSGAGFRLPEPTRIADREAGSFSRDARSGTGAR